MRNCDKYSKEEILIATGPNNTHPAIVDGKPISCEGVACIVCDLRKHHTGCHNCAQEFLFWLYSEIDPEKEEDKNDQNKEIEDLKKAIWYINRSIEQISKEGNQ